MGLKMEELRRIPEITNRLNGLLKDPQDGHVGWWMALNDCMTELKTQVDGYFDKKTENSNNIFHLILAGDTDSAVELVQLGKYDCSNDLITNQRFPLKKHEPKRREVELFQFDYDPTTEQALEEYQKRNLERPTAEDALYFGIQHPEEQWKRPIVFLHEPVRGPSGSQRVLVLDRYGSDRSFYLVWAGNRWSRRCAFAGVRKPA